MTFRAMVLYRHGIEYRINGDDILALDVLVDRSGKVRSTWINVTDWTLDHLMKWLGY